MILRWFLWILVALGLAAALFNGWRRWQVEQSSRTVEIVLDYGELRSLSAQTGQGFLEVCRTFKQVGATSVAITEDNISGLEESKRVELVPTDAIGESYFFAHQGNFRRVYEALKNKTRYTVVTPPGIDPLAADPKVTDELGMRVNEPFSIVRGLGVGLDPRAVEAVKESGLGIVGRVANFPGMQSNGIRYSLEQLKSQGVHTIIFTGDEVIGYKHLVGDDPKDPKMLGTSTLLSQVGLSYGTVEFGKQKGDPELTKLAADSVARVHTVTGSEMVTATIPDNIQRFLLAARERNIRVLYVRLFPDEREPLDTNARYVRAIARGLDDAGFSNGPAHGFAPLTNPILYRGALGLGLAAGILLLLDALTGMLAGGARGLLPLAFTLALAVGALPALPSLIGVKLAALASAAVFPALGMVLVDFLAPDEKKSPAALVLGRFFLASGVTLIGAAYVVGFLADRLFMIKADAFMGIKFSQLIPLLVVTLAYLLHLRSKNVASLRERFREDVLGARALLARPILVWQVAAAIGALAVVFLLVARSGNDPGVGVSDFELKIRAILDRVLYARPRFKEFLIGHPAMIVALAMAARGWRRWAAPVFLVGAIGQVSLLNTFCHIHTPLLVSLWRAGLGILIGLALGGLLVLFLPKPRPEKIAEA